jgi:sporulation protein YlmC with PRC-barrel domain
MNNRILSASTINGTNVKNLADENIGEIQDLMINLETGNVVYAVLSFGGFLGIGDKYFAVPVEALKFSTRDREITLDVDKEILKNAPGFDKNDWPQEASPEFVQSMYDHYGYEPQRNYVRK